MGLLAMSITVHPIHKHHREKPLQCVNHEHLSPAYVIHVWTVHLIFTQKMSHREQGLSVTVHMIFHTYSHPPKHTKNSKCPCLIEVDNAQE